MVGVNGKKYPDIRKHLQDNIANVYKDMDISCVSLQVWSVSQIPIRISARFDSYPAEDKVDPLSCAFCCPAFLSSPSSTEDVTFQTRKPLTNCPLETQ